MLISDAPVRQHSGEPDAGLTLLAYFSRHPTRAHVSISGSVATYLIGTTERVSMRRRSSVLPPDRPATSLSCCLMRSKTQPIEKCSHRPVEARAADASTTHSEDLGPSRVRHRVRACEHSEFGCVLLHVDNGERANHRIISSVELPTPNSMKKIGFLSFAGAGHRRASSFRLSAATRSSRTSPPRRIIGDRSLPRRVL